MHTKPAHRADTTRRRTITAAAAVVVLVATVALISTGRLVHHSAGPTGWVAWIEPPHLAAGIGYSHTDRTVDAFFQVDPELFRR